MLKRYHRDIGFRESDKPKLAEITAQLNAIPWEYKHFTGHCLDRVNESLRSLEKLIGYIKTVKLGYDMIFEYYVSEYNIVKILYRIPYNKYQDIIMVLTSDKTIVTVYYNDIGDNHSTLDKSLYEKVN